MSTTPPAPPTPDPGDAWLDDLLRQPAHDTAASPRDDAAQFTARVLASLPPPAIEVQRAARRRRGSLLAAATALGCGIAWLCGGTSMMESLREIAHVAQEAIAPVQLPESFGLYLIAGISALAMLGLVGRRDLRRLFRI